MAWKPGRVEIPSQYGMEARRPPCSPLHARFHELFDLGHHVEKPLFPQARLVQRMDINPIVSGAVCAPVGGWDTRRLYHFPPSFFPLWFWSTSTNCQSAGAG